jgi:hypothetical protein
MFIFFCSDCSKLVPAETHVDIQVKYSLPQPYFNQNSNTSIITGKTINFEQIPLSDSSVTLYGQTDRHDETSSRIFCKSL